MEGITLFFKRMLLGAILLVVIAASSVLGFAGIIYWQVTQGDFSTLQKSTILAKIKEETTLFYLDEKTRIGSIFESRHRRYVPIEEIPQHLLHAIVAAEDKNFYHHFGVDPTAISKAFWEGIRGGGRFRRGGSTITQQTVKNIIDDWETSFSRKFREMIKALQLERLYSKDQILEFYLNQFHVAGNGTGVGVAAKYYFNKDVKELNLVEAAFIAGSVKGPGKYNPFIKFSKKTREKAEDFANDRKNYVLSRMQEQGWITIQEYEEAKVTRVPFNKGEFSTSEVSLVELIRSQLEKKEVLHALGLTNPEDLNIAGLRVFTTIDSDFQNAAQLAMRRNLSRLETIMEGFRPEDPSKYHPLRELREDHFFYGKVEEIVRKGPKEVDIRISFGFPSGVIPYASLVRYAKLLDLPDGKGWETHLKELLQKVSVGDVLFTQVMEYAQDTHHAVLELQKTPKISGGLIALDKGEVRATISGFDTLGYNRAIYAKRQPGSVFKSLVYFASLQLGWSILDRLDNLRQIFPYQGRLYYPRPDHKSPYDNVSMLWAGIMSENLASVGLGARLLEKINFDQFKQLMDHFGFLPKPQELPRDFHYRVAKAIGVTLDNEGIRAYQLENAVNEVAPDLVFAGDQDTLKKLKQMWWGNGYLEEANTLLQHTQTDIPTSELKIRLRLASNSFLHMKDLQTRLQKDWTQLRSFVASYGADKAFADANMQTLLDHFRVLNNSHANPDLGYFVKVEGEILSALGSDFSLSEPFGRKLNLLDAEALWGKGDVIQGGASTRISQEEVKLNGLYTSGMMNKLNAFVEDHYQQIVTTEDPYQLNRYYQHFDFRTGLGLYYLTKLSAACGVYNKLEPVLSFPLGTNDVTASEVAKVYQTFISGKTYRFYDEGLNNQINFIRRIEDRFGHVLFEPKMKDYQLVNPQLAAEMRELLKKVVTHGTGRRARGELYVNVNQPTGEGTKQKETAVRIPSFGKTGTTNDFITSYYAGSLPYPDPKNPKAPLDPENSYVIATYVGYDFNKMMRNGRQRIYGSVGALPLWTDFSKEIIKVRKYSESLDTTDPTILSRKEWPLKLDKNSSSLMVDLPRGLIMRSSGGGDGENWKTTDIASTGEQFEDSYALDASVASSVRLPADPRAETWQPLRIFSPFNTKPSPNDQPLISAVTPKESPTTTEVVESVASVAASEATTPKEPVKESEPKIAAESKPKSPNDNVTEYNENEEEINRVSAYNKKLQEKEPVHAENSAGPAENFDEENIW